MCVTERKCHSKRDQYSRLTISLTPATMAFESNLFPSTFSPPLIHLCVPPVVLSWTPAVATKRRQGALRVSEECGPPWYLCHSVFGLLFSFSSSTTSTTTTTTVKSCIGSSPSLDTLQWAPTAFQALASLKTGAGWTNTGCVVRGGTGDGNLTGTVSSCYTFIVLQTFEKYIWLLSSFNSLSGQDHVSQ